MAAPVALALPLFLLKRSDGRIREFGTTQGIVGVAHGEVFIRVGSEGELRAQSIDGKRSRTVRIFMSRRAVIRGLIPLAEGRTLLHIEEPGPEMHERGAHPVNGAKNPPGQRSRLWELSASSGEARELLTHLSKNSLRVGENLCFWLNPTSSRTGNETIGNRKLKRRIYENDLMVTPIDGTVSRRVATGLRSFTQLEPVGDGVSWRGTPENGGSHDDRYLSFPPEYKVRVLRNVKGTLYPLGSRLCWIDTPLLVSGTPSESSIMTSDRLGQNHRLLARLGLDSEWLPNHQILGSSGGRLFGIFNKRLNGPSGTYYGMAPYLACITESTIVPLKRLPEGGMALSLDQDYFYYLVPERRDNWFDWSPSGLLPQVRWVLYRTPLPPEKVNPESRALLHIPAVFRASPGDFVLL